MNELEKIFEEYGLTFHSYRKEESLLKKDIFLAHYHFLDVSEEQKEKFVRKMACQLIDANLGKTSGFFSIGDYERFQEKGVRKKRDVKELPNSLVSEIEIALVPNKTKEKMISKTSFYRAFISKAVREDNSTEMQKLKNEIWNEVEESKRLKAMFEERKKNQFIVKGIAEKMDVLMKKINRGKAMKEFKKEVEAFFAKEIRKKMVQEIMIQKEKANLTT